MERTFVTLNNFIREINSYLGYCFMRNPKQAEKAAVLAKEIMDDYLNENIKLIPSGFENYSFKDLRKIIDYADSIFDKIDTLEKLSNTGV